MVFYERGDPMYASAVDSATKQEQWSNDCFLRRVQHMSKQPSTYIFHIKMHVVPCTSHRPSKALAHFHPVDTEHIVQIHFHGILVLAHCKDD
jgi:hypothetical protein